MNFKELESFGKALKKAHADLINEVMNNNDLPDEEKAAFQNLMKKTESGEFTLSDAQNLMNDLKEGNIKNLSDACSN